MANPESTSSRFPSTEEELHLFVKSALEEGIRLQQLSLARPTEKSASGIYLCDDDFSYYTEEVDTARSDRQYTVEQFRRHYTYGSSTLADGCNSSTEKKTCVWSSGTHSWLDKSSGIMWVAVHGTDSICVVTRDEKLDVTRVSGFLKHTSEMEVLQCFRETVVYEVEGLADPSSGLRPLFDLDQTIEKPFGVVSVIPGTNKVDEESGHKGSSGKKAIKFLEEKMKSDSDFSYNETIQTAISAFQHLFRRRKFKAKEIKVCVWKENWIPYDLSRSDVKEHLSVINS